MKNQTQIQCPTIQYYVGDATKPVGDGNRIICHIVNTVNKWGKGFVVPLGNKYPISKKSYHNWFTQFPKPKLGDTQFVKVKEFDNSALFVANMMAQLNIFPINNVPPIRYDALRSCLVSVADFCIKNNINSAHMPRIGAGLAGGDWNIIANIITEELANKNILPIVYDLQKIKNTRYDTTF